jgi:hypothetical protein
MNQRGASHNQYLPGFPSMVPNMDARLSQCHRLLTKPHSSPSIGVTVIGRDLRDFTKVTSQSISDVRSTTMVDQCQILFIRPPLTYVC